MKTLLVPTDFTEVADFALQHAVKTAEVIAGNVALLHVVDESEEVSGAKEKLNEIIEKFKTTHPSVEIKPLIRIGNIFDDIGDTASELDAELIFMGTHGATGWQKITGSYAMKVISHSKVPFVILQDKGINESGYDDIVVPLDLHKETKQKLEMVANMAKYFESKVHLITPHETDEFLKNQLDRNIYFAKQYLGEREIEYTTKVNESGDFDKAVVEHAKNVDADLITIMNLHKSSIFKGILGSKHEQHLITNDAKIPVMMVNPSERGYSSFKPY